MLAAALRPEAEVDTLAEERTGNGALDPLLPVVPTEAVVCRLSLNGQKPAFERQTLELRPQLDGVGQQQFVLAGIAFVDAGVGDMAKLYADSRAIVKLIGDGQTEPKPESPAEILAGGRCDARGQTAPAMEHEFYRMLASIGLDMPLE